MTYKQWLMKKKPKEILKWFEDIALGNSRPMYILYDMLYEEMEEEQEEEIGYHSYLDVIEEQRKGE